MADKKKKKASEKKSSLKKTSDKKSHFIELAPHTYTLLQELKASFEEITDITNMEEDDVINILIQGFIESTKAGMEEHGCGCGSSHASEDTPNKKDGECCGGACSK